MRLASGHVEAGERSLLRKLHDHRVSHVEGGAQLPGLHQQGEAPGDDLTADSVRLVAGVEKVEG